MWRPHIFRLGIVWTHAGRRLGIVTITRVASAEARELAARILFHDRMTRQWRDFFSVVGQWLQW